MLVFDRKLKVKELQALCSLSQSKSTEQRSNVFSSLQVLANSSSLRVFLTSPWRQGSCCGWKELNLTHTCDGYYCHATRHV